MKTIKLSILMTLIALFMITSCTDEYDTPDNTTNCTFDQGDHINALPLQNLIDRYTSEGFVGMTLLVDDPTDGLWVGSSGYASIEQETKMNPCHLHHTASIYKTYTATVIMQLVEEGKIDLNDKLSDHLSSNITDKLPNGNEVSIKNLLQQRSGIPDIFEVDFITDFFNHPLKSYTIEELLEYVYDKEPLSNVGTDFYYSDANFSLLSLVIESVDGNYIESFKSRIFEPLNLKDTYFLDNPSQAPIGLSGSYWDRYDDGNLENNSDVQIALTAGLRGSDGILASANDLKTFIQALASGDLVSNLSQMTDFISVPIEIQQQQVFKAYGMGLMNVNVSEEEWYGHFGNQIGSGSIVLYNASRDLTIVALQNKGTFFSDEIKAKFFYQLLSDIEAIVL